MVPGCSGTGARVPPERVAKSSGIRNPTMISVAHWGRLENGDLFAHARYVEWAVLMKRTLGFEIL
jgi:hypothetical protein